MQTNMHKLYNTCRNAF